MRGYELERSLAERAQLHSRGLPAPANSWSDDADLVRGTEEAAHERAAEALLPGSGPVVVADAAQHEHTEVSGRVDRTHLGDERVHVGPGNGGEQGGIEGPAAVGRGDQLQLDPIGGRRDVADRPVPAQRRDEWRRGHETRAEYGNVDVVVRAVKPARAFRQQAAHDLERLAVPRGPVAGSRVVDARGDGLLLVPPCSQTGLEPAVGDRLHLQRGLGELDGRAEQVVGERGGQHDP